MAPTLTLLGTGGPKPDPDRAASTVLLRAAGRNLLFDAGRGVTTRLVQAAIGPQDLDAIFITHHHFDHIGNLGDLLLSIWNNGRTRRLDIYGPAGTRAIVDALFNRVYRADIAFRKREAEITGDSLADMEAIFRVIDVDAGPVLEDGDLRVNCARVSHGHGLGISHEDWPCLGYRVEIEGKAIAISGDTVDCEGLEQLARDADALVLCCYLARAEQNDFERDVISRHIIVSSAEAGKIAQRYNAKTLIVTHIRRKAHELLSAMEADIARDFSGRIVIGRDLTTFDLSSSAHMAMRDCHEGD